MKISIIHPGSRHGYAIPLIFCESDLLFKVYTDFFVSHKISKYGSSIFEMLGCQKLAKYLQSRTSCFLNSQQVNSLPFGYLEDFINLSKNKNLYDRLQHYRRQTASLSKKATGDEEQFQGLYAFFMGGLEGFQLMPDKVKILDIIHLPHAFLIPHLRQEFQKFSDWVTVPDMYHSGADRYIINREKQELELADLILCPSELVKETVLQYVPQKKSQIYLNQYPVPLWVNNYIQSETFNNIKKSFSLNSEPLKILFVGTVNLRKGVQYLLPALRLLKQINFEAKIVGAIDINQEKIAEYEEICEFTGAVSKSELAKLYIWADLFVFPSIAEGSAGVVYEAMSFGLPILTTKASGSVVRDGVDGFVMSHPSVEEIAEKIFIFSQNKSLLTEMSHHTLNRVSEFSWQNSVKRYSHLMTSTIARSQF